MRRSSSVAAFLRVSLVWSQALLLATGVGRSEEDGAAPRPRAAKPMIWKVEGKERIKPVYLLACVPVPNGPAAEAGPQVETIFKESRVLISDVSPDPQHMARNMQKLLLPEDKTLEEVLGKELNARLGKEMNRAMPGWNVMAVQRYHGWYLSFIVPMLEAFKPQGGTQLEEKLWQRGQMDGKKLISLERDEDLFKPFSELTDGEEAQLVEEMLDAMDRQRDKNYNALEKLTTAYISGDVRTYRDAFQNQRDFVKDLTDAKLQAKIDRGRVDLRNRLAASLIGVIEQHPGETCLALFGVDHLALTAGIQPRLEKAGYTVSRLAPDGGDGEKQEPPKPEAKPEGE